MSGASIDEEVAISTARSGPMPVEFVLTTVCPDTTGIVAAIASFLAQQGFLITEAQHHNDSYSVRSFMRTVFRCGCNAPLSLSDLDGAFAEAVGRRFGMLWHFHPVARKCRVLLAVSKQGHCLVSMLHRWSTATLPIEIVGVVSNHQDLRSLSEWHGVPFHYFPIIEDRKSDQEQRICQLFEETGAELLVLARYMQILSADVCASFAGRAINIHHSFLPGFKGARAYHQAHARGVKLIGATAHYITTDLDEGPIIEQESLVSTIRCHPRNSWRSERTSKASFSIAR